MQSPVQQRLSRLASLASKKLSSLRQSDACSSLSSADMTLRNCCCYFRTRGDEGTDTLNALQGTVSSKVGRQHHCGCAHTLWHKKASCMHSWYKMHRKNSLQTSRNAAQDLLYTVLFACLCTTNALLCVSGALARVWLVSVFHSLSRVRTSSLRRRCSRCDLACCSKIALK